MNNEVILASASPRRRELLKLIFDDFDIIVPRVEEIVPSDVAVLKHAEYLSLIKCSAVAKEHPDSIVIGADTIVLADNVILGKPKDKKEAYKMMKMLSGKTHQVITGCTVIKGDKINSFSVTTEVEFYNLENEEIEEYINTSEPYDKAGGYGIQSKGGLFVKQIKGDYFNVVGLPVAELSRIIKKF